MARRPQDVTEAELAVLQLLWDRECATVRELMDELYPEGGSSPYATVQKLLERLEAKGCVRRDRESWPHTFRPNVGRDELIGRRLQSTADQLCDGSLQPLITHLVQNKKLSARDRNSLRELLDELDSRSRRKKK
ncbi:MAG: penicillinase repressor [Planctomycetaceae bacterium]|nr:penicillinase repressor [Planctomycetaceae bacterium]